MKHVRFAAKKLIEYNNRLMKLNPIPPAIMVILFILIGIMSYCKTHNHF